MLALVLRSFETNSATEECSGNQNTLNPYDVGCLNIIFTLLIKIVAVHMEFFEICFQGCSLKKSLLWLYLRLGLCQFHEDFHESCIKSSVKRGIRGRVVASGEIKALVEALSLLILDPHTGPWPTSLFCSPVKLTRKVTEGLCLAEILKLLQKIR